jgi:hypothetical protein
MEATAGPAGGGDNKFGLNQFIGQRLYKHDGKLSKRAQEVTGMPLINFNLYPAGTTKEPLKRTISACTTMGKTLKYSK